MNRNSLSLLIAGIFTVSTFAVAQSQNTPNTAEHAQHDHSSHSTGQHNEQEADQNHVHHEHIDHNEHQHSSDHAISHEHDHTMDHSTHTIHSSDHASNGVESHHHHMDHDHIMDHEGTMIMGQNFDKLPSSCQSISEEVEITVRAGRKYSAKFPGTAFAFDQQQWNVKPCSKITWHFVNEDNIRHQFMMHGLPKYLYKLGMFHLEVTGPKTVSGAMIVPGKDETFLVHCDISHHMEKGMKAQLVVGKGGTNIPSIPGLTPYNLTDTYEAENLPKSGDKVKSSKMVRQITQFTNDNLQTYGMILIGILLGLLCIPLVKRILWSREKVGTS
ncbi:MAG: copper oxidase [Nitrosomonas sp.]|nr:copper oxidase [Nitrosomonas sp.]MBK7365423.1 copper oxidase [Nitrosomonas sp.]